jgi:hypothetical protein
MVQEARETDNILMYVGAAELGYCDLNNMGGGGDQVILMRKTVRWKEFHEMSRLNWCFIYILSRSGNKK